MRKTTMIAAVLACSLFCASQVYAAINYTFTWVVEDGEDANSPNADAIIGMNQLSVELDSTAGGVSFLFKNVGLAASSITDIYFDYDAIDSMLSFVDFSASAGVYFSEGASPGDLSGGQAYSFTTDWSADSDAKPDGTQADGVNPGEYLGINFAFVSDAVFQDIVDAIADGSLRIGIHVQGFADGGSEAFIMGGDGSTEPQGAVPEPATMVLMGVGLIGLGIGIRRKTA